MLYQFHDLKNKHIVITGASGDIGLSICKALLDQEAYIHAIYNNTESTLLDLKQKHNNGHLLTLYQCNLSELNNINQCITEIENNTDHIDILVNNAGMYKDTLFSSLNLDDFDEVIKINLYGTVRMTKQLLPLLRQSKAASVINISSLAGVTSSFGQTSYSAAKAGIIGFTRTLASELASKGIRVNAIAPGMVESRMVKRVSRQIIRSVVTMIPARRLGFVDEIANIVLFLGSSASSYIVGQTIVADGGLIMR